MLDSAGQPAAVIELTEVRVVSISEVDDDSAEFLGAAPTIDDDTLVVTERFRLVKSDDSASL